MDVWNSKIQGIMDGHVHMDTIAEEASLLDICEATGITTMALVSIQDPAAGAGLPQSLYMKARYPERFFVFAGLNHATQLSGGRVKALSLAEQVDMFVELGCDGIKMIEGKPTSRQRMDIPVTDPYFAEYWARVEEVGLPIVWHVNDPEEFWNPERIPGWAKERNWGYGPDDVQKESLYAEVDEVLARHPKLKITFAHFYFLSADLERAGRFFDMHPTARFDLAPGVEMLYNLSRDPDASRAFFIKYADRIVFGTDLFSRLSVAQARARAGIVFRWLESEDTFHVPEEADFLLGPPEDGTIRGMALPVEVLTRIYRDNFIRLAGSVPCALNVSLAVEECRRLAAMAEVFSGTPAAETEAARVAMQLTSEECNE
ncbi:MAG: amidohydrolase family protein [Anaerolineae bacterium]|nr:amidohydrolase family protein [Anaerolineae bacterium]